MEFLRIQKGRNRQVLKRYSLVRPRRDVIYIFRKSSDFERLAWAHVVTLFSAHRKRIDGRPPSPKSYGERERGRDDRRPRSCSPSRLLGRIKDRMRIRRCWRALLLGRNLLPTTSSRTWRPALRMFALSCPEQGNTTEQRV